MDAWQLPLNQIEPTTSQMCEKYVTSSRPRIVRGLREQGLRVGPERVRRSLRRQALRPVYKRPYRVTTDSNHRRPVAPNALDRRFDGWNLNRAWVADVTYLSTAEGWLYVAVVMDLASRRIVGWSMSDRIVPSSCARR